MKQATYSSCHLHHDFGGTSTDPAAVHVKLKQDRLQSTRSSKHYSTWLVLPTAGWIGTSTRPGFPLPATSDASVTLVMVQGKGSENQGQRPWWAPFSARLRKVAPRSGFRMREPAAGGRPSGISNAWAPGPFSCPAHPLHWAAVTGPTGKPPSASWIAGARTCSAHGPHVTAPCTSGAAAGRRFGWTFWSEQPAEISPRCRCCYIILRGVSAVLCILSTLKQRN